MIYEITSGGQDEEREGGFDLGECIEVVVQEMDVSSCSSSSKNADSDVQRSTLGACCVRPAR